EKLNIFEYGVVKTPERTPLFKWIGIVGPAEQVLFALSGRKIRIEKLEDLKNYIIGTAREDVVDQYLRPLEDSIGFKTDTVASYKKNMRKLFKGRFDFWAGNRLVGYHLAESLGHKMNEIEVVYTFHELTDYYYLITNKKTPEKNVKKLRKAFEIIHNNGIYEKIVREHIDRAHSHFPGL
ncbi:MAG: ABC transporter substrate-binding protein, partial [Desulfobacteraceae bacterium]|nr:ABC transporter substrate-binding protein [Desulfobacteraceae bacterium]